MDILDQMFLHIWSDGVFKSTYVGKIEKPGIYFLVFQLIEMRSLNMGSPDWL